MSISYILKVKFITFVKEHIFLYDKNKVDNLYCYNWSYSIYIKAYYIYSFKGKIWDFLANSIDFVFFGLALNLSNINEIENFNASIDAKWATKFKGFSTIAIIVFSSILGMLYISEQQADPIISDFSTFIVSVLLGVTSFVISYAIFSKLNQLHNANS